MRLEQEFFDQLNSIYPNYFDNNGLDDDPILKEALLEAGTAKLKSWYALEEELDAEPGLDVWKYYFTHFHIHDICYRTQIILNDNSGEELWLMFHLSLIQNYYCIIVAEKVREEKGLVKSRNFFSPNTKKFIPVERFLEDYNEESKIQITQIIKNKHGISRLPDLRKKPISRQNREIVSSRISRIIGKIREEFKIREFPIEYLNVYVKRKNEPKNQWKRKTFFELVFTEDIQ